MKSLKLSLNFRQILLQQLYIFVVVVITVSATWAVALMVTANRLDQAYAALEAKGVPMQAADIIPKEVADSDNAALLYQAVALQFRSLNYEAGGFDEMAAAMRKAVIKKQPEDGQLEQLTTLVESEAVKSLLNQLIEAANKPAYRQNIDYQNSGTDELPHLNDINKLSWVLVSSAILVAPHDADVAWQRLLAAFKMANHGHDEPAAVSQLVRAMQLSFALNGLERILQSTPPSASMASAINEQLQKAEILNSYVQSLHGERLLLGEWVFDHWQKFMLQNGESPNLMSRICEGSWMRHLDHAHFLERMADLHAFAEAPFAPGEAEAMEKKWDELSSHSHITKYATVSLGKIKNTFLKTHARVQMGRIALALHSHVTQHGTYPASLAELGEPGALLDPFSGQSFHYRRDDQQVCIYSIGKDGQDNQGQPAPSKKESDDKENGDIVWRIR